MKCPACGFENPDEREWCDFCKEPFRRKKAAAEPPASPAAGAEAEAAPRPAPEPERPKQPAKGPSEVKVPPEVWAKLMETKKASKGEEDGTADAAAPGGPIRPGDGGKRNGPAGIPAEFAHLDAGERMPTLPPTARKLAWAFLAVCVFWIIFGTVWLARNMDSIAAKAAASSKKEGKRIPPPPAVQGD